MHVVWLMVAVAWGGKWDGETGDVEVEATVPAPASQVHAELADLQTFRDLLPEHCATDWVLRSPTQGVDATAEVKYTLGPLRRRLTAVITRDEPGRLFQIEHAGNRGWYTRFTYEEGATDDTTVVTLLTPLNPPPWPFRGPFFRKVKPAMTHCYTEALGRLAERLQ